jgi:hypothetical protein
MSHKGREIWTAPEISPWTKVLDCRDPYASMKIEAD